MRVVAPQLSHRAAGVLRQIFADVRADFAFRLWDGTRVPFGSDAPAFTVVIHAPDTFMRLMRDPTPLTFGEAYVGGAIDIDGDLFAAMHVANALEAIRIPLAQRLRLLLSLGPAALRPPRQSHP
jgi:cyclopropane-fatty-acyl-phospholipid synthase